MAAITVRLQHLKDNAHRNADLLADRREVLDWYSAKKREIAAEKEATQRALVAETSVQMTPTDAGARDTGFADLDCGKSTGRTSRRSMVRRSQAAVSPARTPGDERGRSKSYGPFLTAEPTVKRGSLRDMSQTAFSVPTPSQSRRHTQGDGDGSALDATASPASAPEPQQPGSAGTLLPPSVGSLTNSRSEGSLVFTNRLLNAGQAAVRVADEIAYRRDVLDDVYARRQRDTATSEWPQLPGPPPSLSSPLGASRTGTTSPKSLLATVSRRPVPTKYMQMLREGRSPGIPSQSLEFSGTLTQEVAPALPSPTRSVRERLNAFEHVLMWNSHQMSHHQVHLDDVSTIRPQ
eukprot:TRINITY_DN27235_c0_g1_i2.p1 TRINITY_DN27235_c0_g1~~TRINITY_DN27235_c0_g1_i2.p1  ORF type:complete len:368 (+),score=61.74 TRINITY_DN27235_c0_g1_i2:58-1104(+)